MLTYNTTAVCIYTTCTILHKINQHCYDSFHMKYFTYPWIVYPADKLLITILYY